MDFASERDRGEPHLSDCRQTRTDQLTERLPILRAHPAAAESSEKRFAPAPLCFLPTRAGDAGGLHGRLHPRTQKRGFVATRVRPIDHVAEGTDRTVEENP